jgi:hypothetical protein
MSPEGVFVWWAKEVTVRMLESNQSHKGLCCAGVNNLSRSAIPIRRSILDAIGKEQPVFTR